MEFVPCVLDVNLLNYIAIYNWHYVVEHYC